MAKITDTLILLLECLVLSSVSADGLHQTMLTVSRNLVCKGVYNLSSQTDSYKLTFPKRDRHCQECQDCYILTSYLCMLTFTADPFTLKSFQICFDNSRQKVTGCEEGRVTFVVGSEYLYQKYRERPSLSRCLDDNEGKVEVNFFSLYSCCFEGSTQVFLLPKDIETYVLCRENRRCPPRPEILEFDHGTIVSQFSHRTQISLDFCPVIVHARKSSKYRQFCLWFEVADFASTEFTITISSTEGDEGNSSYSKFTEINRKFCSEVWPKGYFVSVTMSEILSLNDHRIILKYSYEGKNTDNDDDNDDDDDDDAPEIYEKIFRFLLSLIGLLMIACFVGIVCKFCYKCLTRRRQGVRERIPGTASNQPQTNYQSQTDGGFHVPPGHAAEAQQPVVASAPLAHFEGASYQSPPSYESLFPLGTKTK